MAHFYLERASWAEELRGAFLSPRILRRKPFRYVIHSAKFDNDESRRLPGMLTRTLHPFAVGPEAPVESAPIGPLIRAPDRPISPEGNSIELGQQCGRRATRLTYIAPYNFLRIRQTKTPNLLISPEIISGPPSATFADPLLLPSRRRLGCPSQGISLEGAGFFHMGSAARWKARRPRYTCHCCRREMRRRI